MTAKPFTIDISEAVLMDLKHRVERTRWPRPMPEPGWTYGADPAYMKELANCWVNTFDWRARERYLNTFPQFTAEVDGQLIHFVHVRGKGTDNFPIILTHGWPSTFVEHSRIVPLLAERGFDVVVPSLPGYGFSGRPTKPGLCTNANVAAMWAKLMTETLGYKRFGAFGSDIGAGITMYLGMNHGDCVVGIHLPGVLTAPPRDRPLTEEEQRFLAERDKWMRTEAGYATQQATYPQTLAYGLNDSPVGLAAWIVDKHRAWSDCDGDVEKRFTKDELLTNITIYWVTGTINSSFLFYYDRQHAQPVPPAPIRVPVGVATFPKEIFHYRRDWAERDNNIVRWVDFDRGGHFPAWEEPELLAGEITAFFEPLR